MVEQIGTVIGKVWAIVIGNYDCNYLINRTKKNNSNKTKDELNHFEVYPDHVLHPVAFNSAADIKSIIRGEKKLRLSLLCEKISF